MVLMYRRYERRHIPPKFAMCWEVLLTNHTNNTCHVWFTTALTSCVSSEPYRAVSHHQELFLPGQLLQCQSWFTPGFRSASLPYLRRSHLRTTETLLASHLMNSGVCGRTADTGCNKTNRVGWPGAPRYYRHLREIPPRCISKPSVQCARKNSRPIVKAWCLILPSE